MSDVFTILQHGSANIAKTWNADGTITPYGDAKYFVLRTHPVADFSALVDLLRRLEKAPRSCVIRGGYVGDSEAQRLDVEHRPGYVRRLKDTFPDRPLHAVMFDVDGFYPLASDPVADPQGAVEEYIRTALPPAFHGAAHFWQLSNSAGRPEHAGKLKAHIWFWLQTPLTGAQLTAWAQEGKIEVDVAPFRCNQVLYTANPIFAEGVVDPVAVRSGCVQGFTVDLQLSETALAAQGNASRNARVADIRSTDPIGQHLAAKGLVKSERKDGGLNIVCPFEAGHSTESGETSTIYYPANTGGYAKPAFKCLHGSCEGRSTDQYLNAIGYDVTAEIIADFAALTQSAAPGGLVTEVAPDGTVAVRQLGVPDAQHSCTHLANAQRLQKHFGSMVFATADRWYGWDGKRWVQDEAMVTRAAFSLSRIIKEEVAKLELQFEENPAEDIEEQKRRDKIIAKLAAWGATSEMTSTMEATLKALKKLIPVDPAKLDRNPWLLNVANGTVDLRTGQLKPHDPLDYITKLAPVPYNPALRSQTWIDTVARVTLEHGKAEKPLADFMQRWFGYGCTGETREQKLAVHYGDGKNGKSTILDIIAEVLGEYAGIAAPGLLTSPGTDRHPTEIADLFGKRMVTAMETGEDSVLREDFVKQATGGDRLKARFMGGDFFEFMPTHIFNVLTNHKPVIKGQDSGIWRRIMLIPYKAVFGTPEEVACGKAHWVRDTRTVENLKDELPGVLTWLVEGARMWFENGLQEPEIVLEASRTYQGEQDRIAQFVAEVCELDPAAEVALTEGFGGLYPAYTSWCREGGMHPLSKIKLRQQIERIVGGPDVVSDRLVTVEGKRRRVTFIRGLRIADGL